MEPDPELLGRLDADRRRPAVPHPHDRRRPEDPGFREAQEDPSEVLERQNPILSYVARRMLTERPWADGNGTIEDVRRTVREFYDRAGRDRPECFPADEPAERTSDTGRLDWQRDIRGGRVTFEPEPNAITADFDREEYEAYDYERRLPRRFMSENPPPASTSAYPRSSSNGSDTPSTTH